MEIEMEYCGIGLEVETGVDFGIAFGAFYIRPDRRRKKRHGLIWFGVSDSRNRGDHPNRKRNKNQSRTENLLTDSFC